MVERGQFQEEAEVESQVTISAETQKDLTDEQRVLGVRWKRNLDLVDFLSQSPGYMGFQGCRAKRISISQKHAHVAAPL